MFTGDFRNVKLEEKLNRLGLAFEGVPHRADVDSHNIARLMIELSTAKRR
jgi:inhibitor of KinA sporulation pathway (predicted exonuclease)